MASKSVNKVVLLGHLGKDAETKFTPSGVSRTTFTLATSRRWKDQQSGEWKEETDWHSCVMWRAENLANYLLKGKQIYVEGRLQTRSYDDKEGHKKYTTEVVCEAQNLILLAAVAAATVLRRAAAIMNVRSRCPAPHSGPRRRPDRNPTKTSIKALPTTTFRFKSEQAIWRARVVAAGARAPAARFEPYPAGR